MKLLRLYVHSLLACWAYSFQTFSAGEVLGASKMNQIEVNIRDHVHGAGSVAQVPIASGVSGLGSNVATFLGNALGSSMVTFLGTPSSANLAAAVTDETGSGSLVFASSPTLSGPALGTPASGTLTNCTNLPQSGLKTTTGDVSVNETSAHATLPGGEYGFWPNIQTTGTGALSGIAAPWETATVGTVAAFGFRANISMFVSAPGVNGVLTARQRYVQASPPYDLGDGEVPLFVFALVDSNGKVLVTYSAEDPPWANNGPTNIRPDFVDRAGRAYKFHRNLTKSALLLPGLRDQELGKLLAAPEIIEITQEVKQADMPLIPHPFLLNDLTGKTVVLLDPVSQITDRLHRMQQQEESVVSLLHEDYLRFDNSPLLRAGPPGVLVVAPKWKSS